MIKRIRFATRRPGISSSEFAAGWADFGDVLASVPPTVRPRRTALCALIARPGESEPPHDGISLEWFDDLDAAERFASWLDSDGGVAVRDAATGLLDLALSPTIIADELVARGADWLEGRWRDGGEKVKHIAFGRRRPDLTPAEFSDRWKAQAGRVGRVVIPDYARGLAYVQNHPRPRQVGEWAYDAVNEVYFDDLAGLERRVEWFQANAAELSSTEEDFTSPTDRWFVVVREQVVLT